MHAPSIVLVDTPNSGSDGVDLVAMFAAMQKSLDGDFAPLYYLTAELHVGSAQDATSADMVMTLQADMDQPGALGDHDFLAGKPLSRISPVLDKQDGANLSTTIDHELKEMLKNFFLTSAVMSMVDGNFWADEPCDAVEQDEYTVDGYSLSNFVLPGWYSGQGKFDFLGKLSVPLSVNPGGYAQWFDPQRGWQQIVHADKAPRSYRMRETGRSARRRSAFAAMLAKRNAVAVDAKFDPAT